VDAASIAGALEKIGYDTDLYLDLCRICLQEIPVLRERLAGCPAHGAEEVFRLAHSCKNTCGAIGATVCAGLSARVETAARAGDVGRPGARGRTGPRTCPGGGDGARVLEDPWPMALSRQSRPFPDRTVTPAGRRATGSRLCPPSTS
jgi:HPt (histidine-containing phosphotransfer) domain-containing protein